MQWKLPNNLPNWTHLRSLLRSQEASRSSQLDRLSLFVLIWGKFGHLQMRKKSCAHRGKGTCAALCCSCPLAAQLLWLKNCCHPQGQNLESLCWYWIPNHWTLAQNRITGGSFPYVNGRKFFWNVVCTEHCGFVSQRALQVLRGPGEPLCNGVGQDQPDWFCCSGMGGLAMWNNVLIPSEKN